MLEMAAFWCWWHKSSLATITFPLPPEVAKPSRRSNTHWNQETQIYEWQAVWLQVHHLTSLIQCSHFSYGENISSVYFTGLWQPNRMIYTKTLRKRNVIKICGLILLFSHCHSKVPAIMPIISSLWWDGVHEAWKPRNSLFTCSLGTVENIKMHRGKLPELRQPFVHQDYTCIASPEDPWPQFLWSSS